MSQTQLANLEALVPLLRDVLLSNPQVGPEARDQWMALEPALQRSLQPATTGSGPSPAAAAAAAVPSGAVSPLTLPLPDPTPDEYEYERELGVDSKEASEHSCPSERGESCFPTPSLTPFDHSDLIPWRISLRLVCRLVDSSSSLTLTLSLRRRSSMDQHYPPGPDGTIPLPSRQPRLGLSIPIVPPRNAPALCASPPLGRFQRRRPASSQGRPGIRRAAAPPSVGVLHAYR